MYAFPKFDPEMYPIKDDEKFSSRSSNKSTS